MPRRNLTLSKKMDSKLQNYSEETGVPVSKLIRQAIEEWAQKRGIEVKDTVSWGGARTPDDQESGQLAGSLVPIN